MRQPLSTQRTRRVLRAVALAWACAAPFAAQAVDWLYLTVPGDTLIGIGQRYLKNANDWPKIQSVNNVPIPKQLPSNTHLRIPVDLLKVTPAPARVAQVEGNVRVRPESGAFRPLKPGDTLSGGETVLSGPRSSASYVLADGSKLTQADSTKLIFGRLAAYGATGMVSTELSLEAGRIEADASKQTFPGTGFKVATPVAVAGLRGTSFRLNMAEDGKVLRNEVLEGGVGIAAQAQEVVVGAGYGTLAEAGKPPQAPRPLLPAPEAAGLPGKVLDTPIRFAWRADPMAQAWRAQIARDAEFRDVVFDNVYWQPVATWREPLPDGRYHLRLRAIDAVGLEGLNRDHAFELDAQPGPPQTRAPEDGQRLTANPVALSWLAAEAATGYVVQVGEDADFKNNPREQRVAHGTRLDMNLPEGRYFWRVASLDERQAPRAWGKTRLFEVRGAPASPSVPRVDRPYGALRLAWQGNAHDYRIEIADDADFKVIVSRHLTYQPHVIMSAPRPGSYWLRIVPYDADGLRGEPSTPVALKISSLF
jgi:hypothetical protein